MAALRLSLLSIVATWALRRLYVFVITFILIVLIYKKSLALKNLFLVFFDYIVGLSCRSLGGTEWVLCLILRLRYPFETWSVRSQAAGPCYALWLPGLVVLLLRRGLLL